MLRKRSLISSLTFLVVLASAMCVARSASDGDSVTLHKLQIEHSTVYVITANLNDPDLRVDIGLPAKGVSHSDSFMSIVRRDRPVAAATGTYFCTRTLLPVGTIVKDGRVVFANHIGNTICFIAPNSVRFVDTAKGERADLNGVTCALRAGPRLLRNGYYALDPQREGFRQPGLFGRHARMAVGITRHAKLLLVAVTTPVTFGRTAAIMKTLGATDAMCLDGGSSSAMYYRGQLIVKPGRALTNVVELHEVPAQRPVSPAVQVFAVPKITLPLGISETTSAETACWISTVPVPVGRTAASANTTPPVSEQVAVLSPANLSLSQGGGSFLPIHRTKFAGLKSTKYAKRLVHTAADVHIVHYLVA